MRIKINTETVNIVPKKLRRTQLANSTMILEGC